MKFFKIYGFKELGIIFSYLFLLLIYHYFGGDPHYIFLSYLIEFIVVIFLFFSASSLEEFRIKRDITKKQSELKYSISSMYIVAINFIIIQFFLIKGILTETEFAHQQSFWLKPKGIAFTTCCFLLLWVFKLLKTKPLNKRVKIFEKYTLNLALYLSLTNLVGINVILIFGVKSAEIVLIVMTVIRVFLELRYGKEDKSENNTY